MVRSLRTDVEAVSLASIQMPNPSTSWRADRATWCRAVDLGGAQSRLTPGSSSGMVSEWSSMAGNQFVRGCTIEEVSQGLDGSESPCRCQVFRRGVFRRIQRTLGTRVSNCSRRRRLQGARWGCLWVSLLYCSAKILTSPLVGFSM